MVVEFTVKTVYGTDRGSTLCGKTTVLIQDLQS